MGFFEEYGIGDIKNPCNEIDDMAACKGITFESTYNSLKELSDNEINRVVKKVEEHIHLKNTFNPNDAKSILKKLEEINNQYQEQTLKDEKWKSLEKLPNMLIQWLINIQILRENL